MNIEEIIQKVSLNKGVIKEDVEGMLYNLIKQMKEEMGKPELNRILIHNFVSFVPDRLNMLKTLRMCEIMISRGKEHARILELKQVIEEKLKKDLKRKRSQ